ncbi:hypothetical protein BLA29_011322, partial [Euroglyphus maynei]
MTCDWPYNAGCLQSNSRDTTSIDTYNAAASDSTSVQFARYDQPAPQIHHDNEPIVKPKSTWSRKPPQSPMANHRHVVPVSRSRYQQNDNDRIPPPPPSSSYRHPVNINTESTVEQEQSQYNRMGTEFGNPKSAKIMLAPKKVSPNQLYYDPQTGLYHQFHYETRFPSQKDHSKPIPS